MSQLSLSSPELAQRIRASTYVSYTNFAYLIKSGVLAIASLTLINIFSPNASWQTARASLWFASAAMALVGLVTWSRGSLLSNGRMNTWDSFLPMAMGITEFGMFGILSPQNTPNAEWQFWYLFESLHALFAALLVWNRISQTDVQNDFDQDIRHLASALMKWLKFDVIGAAVFSIFPLIMFILARSLPYLKAPNHQYVHGIFGAFIFFGACGVVAISTYQYKLTMRYFLEVNGA